MSQPAAELRKQIGDAVAQGIRMEEARRIADLSLEEGALLLGLACAEDLDAIERGQAVPSLRTAVVAARTYGTTVDFICGLDEDGDRDPASALLRLALARMTADVQSLTRATVANSVGVIRALHPSASEGRRLARLVIDAGQAVAKFRVLNPTFDSDMRGGASVVARLARAVDSAGAYMAKLERAKRVHAMRTAVDAADEAEEAGGEAARLSTGARAASTQAA